MQDVGRAPGPLQVLTLAVLFTSGIVLVEPAPTDLLFFMLLGCVVLMPRTMRLRGFSPVIGAGALLFLLANGLSLMAAETFLSATRYMIITVYMFALSVVLAGWVGRYGPEAHHALKRAFCAGALLVGIIGILARFHVLPNSEMFFLGETALRIRSTFKDPNVFGPFMVAATIFLLNDVLERRRAVWNATLYGTVYALSILFAFSRGAFLHLGVSLVVYSCAVLFVIRKPELSRRLLIGATVAGAALLVAGAYALAAFGLEDFFASRLSFQKYDNERFAMQALTLHVASENILGIGPGEWNVERFENDPHNVYLRVLAENGLLGLIGWVLWCGACVSTAWFGVLRKNANSPSQAAAMAVLVGVFVESLVIDSLHWRHLFYIASIPVGLRIADAYVDSLPPPPKAPEEEPAVAFEEDVLVLVDEGMPGGPTSGPNGGGHV